MSGRIFEGTESASSIERRAATRLWILGRRRSFLVPGAFQKRVLLYVAGMTALLLVALNLSIYKLLQEDSAPILEAAPLLAGMIHAQDNFQLGLSILASVCLFGGIMAVTLLETHKSAGPLHNLRRGLDRLGREGSAVRVKFRKDDYFKELEETFNRTASALEARSRLRAAEAHRLATDLRDAAEKLSRCGHDLGTIPTSLYAIATSVENLREELERG